MFDQAFGFFDDHFGHLNVAHGCSSKVEAITSAANRALHFSHFFRAFVDQQYDQYDIRVASGNGMRNVLQHDGFTGFGQATSRPRWPLPIGFTISMMREVRFSFGFAIPFQLGAAGSGATV